MIDRARSADEHRYLLFIDEAQWLAKVQFRYLMDLHNQLKIADVRLITVLVDQPELLAIKASMRKTGQTQLLGRFMTSTHAYEVVTSQTDFARLCRAIDAQSEYPIGSNVSFTRYFVPRAFENGWRLEAQASAIWTRLEQIRREQGLSKVDELPMQGLTALLRGLLRTLAAEDADDLVLRRPAIDEGIYGVELHEARSEAPVDRS